MNDDNPKFSVLIMDSGIGGMSIVKAVRTLNRTISLTYISDDDYFPYGTMDTQTLNDRLHTLVGQALERFDFDAVIIACNTASTVVLDTLRQTYTIPFIGVVPPIKTASELSKTRVIGLLATQATIQRRYIDDLIQEFASDCKVIRVGSPHLADQAERKVRGETVDTACFRDDLEPLRQQSDDLDVIVLGCTHYPYLQDELKAEFKPGIVWLDPALPVARHLLSVLNAPDNKSRSEHSGKQLQNNVAFFTGNQEHPEDLAAFLSDMGFSHTEYWTAL